MRPDDAAAREIVYVALGSNLGDRSGHLAFARSAIAALPGTRIVAESEVEETAPVGDVPQDPYLNQMIAIETTLAPRDLLVELQRIETAAGRVRTVRWGPRTLDLDVIRYGEQRIAEPYLVVPHPQIGAREFWQREIAALDGALRAGTSGQGR